MTGALTLLYLPVGTVSSTSGVTSQHPALTPPHRHLVAASSAAGVLSLADQHRLELARKR